MERKPEFDDNGKRIIDVEVLPIDSQPTGKEIKLKSDGTVDKRQFNSAKHLKPPEKHRATKERKAQVEAMAAYGIQVYIIAECLEISANTLRKHYKKELGTAKAKATSAIAGKVYQQALKGCTKSQRLFLVNQCGWNAKTEHEVSGIIGHAPLPTNAEQAEYTDPQQASKAYKQMIKDL